MNPYTFYINLARNQLDLTEEALTPKQPIVTYAAYKQGEVRFFSSQHEAKAFSSNTECIFDNDVTEINKLINRNITRVLNLADKLFDADLEEAYHHIPKEVLKSAINHAYDLACASGKDAMVEVLDDLIEFYLSIKE